MGALLCQLYTEQDVRQVTRPALPKFESYQERLVEFVGPRVDYGMLVDVVDGGHDALFQFVADVAKNGAGELGKEALDQIEPRAVRSCEEAACE